GYASDHIGVSGIGWRSLPSRQSSKLTFFVRLQSI
ncbi:hypothetical protein LINPERHAP1_LOCUS11616, partial [Linum perenne]